MADYLADRMRERAGTEIVTMPPIARPHVLGLFAFAGAMFMIATPLAGWYHATAAGNILIAPFAAVLGGLAGFLAAMWAYRSRDTLMTAMFGVWSSAFFGYGLLTSLVASGRASLPTAGSPELGYWFIVLGAISWVGMLGCWRENAGIGLWLGLAGLGSTLAAIAAIGGFGGLLVGAAWVFVIDAIVAWYEGCAIMLQVATGREVIPTGERLIAEERVAPRRVA